MSTSEFSQFLVNFFFNRQTFTSVHLHPNDRTGHPKHPAAVRDRWPPLPPKSELLCTKYPQFLWWDNFSTLRFRAKCSSMSRHLQTVITRVMMNSLPLPSGVILPSKERTLSKVTFLPRNPRVELLHVLGNEKSLSPLTRGALSSIRVICHGQRCEEWKLQIRCQFSCSSWSNVSVGRWSSTSASYNETNKPLSSLCQPNIDGKCRPRYYARSRRQTSRVEDYW